MPEFQAIGKMVLIMSLLALLQSLRSVTSCEVKFTCAVRLEFSSEQHFLRGYKSCQDAYKRDCVCQQPIDVLFNEAPPYIFTSPENKTMGIIPGIIDIALNACCFRSNCTQINYLRPYKSIIDGLVRVVNVTVLTPFVSQTDTEIAMGSSYLPFMKTKGVAYITIQDINYTYFRRFFSSLGSNWPLFCISLLLALDAGIIIWILDSYSNSENFPLRFQAGVIEGFWWAYVSMTTVGYGDKTPKTIRARVFGVIWITIGISVCGVFTASLTTGMTQSLLEEKVNIENRKVGIMNTTRYEQNIAMRERAIVHVYSTFEELQDALVKNHIEGILLDDLVMKYYLPVMKRTITNLYVRRNALKNSETSYGILFPYDLRNATNKKWSSFLKGFFKQNQDNLDMVLELAMRKLPQQTFTTSTMDEDTEAGSLFLFTPVYEALLKLIGYATLVLVFLGYFSEKLLLMLRYAIAWRQDKWMSRVEDANEDQPKPCPEIAQLNHQTVNALHRRFKVTMKEIQLEDEEKDYSDITTIVEEKVFHINKDTRESNNSDKPMQESIINLNETDTSV